MHVPPLHELSVRTSWCYAHALATRREEKKRTLNDKWPLSLDQTTRTDARCPSCVWRRERVDDARYEMRMIAW